MWPSVIVPFVPRPITTTGLNCPVSLSWRMRSIPLPNWRLTAASTRMPGIFVSSAPFAPSITESPIAVTCGGGGGTVGVVGVVGALPGSGRGRRRPGRGRRRRLRQEREPGLDPRRLRRREADAGDHAP